MADGTRQAKFEEIISKLTALQETHTKSIEFLTNSMKDLTMNFQTLDAKVEQSLRKFPNSQPESQPQPSGNPSLPSHWTATTVDSSTPMKSMRLDVPRFSGENASAWISRIQRYFDFYNTPDSQRLLIASFHLDGDALDWYDWMSKNRLLSTWQEFLEAIDKRFGSSEYEDSFGQLSKLLQSGTLAEYQHKFEHLANKIQGVPEHVLVSCFVSGLRSDLRREIQVYRPQSLVQAMGLARLFEDKSRDNQYHQRFNGEFSGNENSVWDSKKSILPPLLPTPIADSSLGNSKINLPITIKKLSAAEMAARREKGLCYNCDEKYFIGHKCQGRLFCFMVDEECKEDEEQLHLFEQQDSVENIPEISLHAMAGQIHPRTLRIQARIAGLTFQTLIDGGSTHNFIQDRVAKFLKLPIIPSPHFNVLVGNGQFLLCNGYCSKVKVQLGNESFSIDFYVLPLQGADLVLGAQWLELLGPITMDYQKLYMEFHWEGRVVRLQGEPLLQVEQMQLNQVKRLGQTEGIADSFLLFSFTTPAASPSLGGRLHLADTSWDAISSFSNVYQLPP